MAPDKRKQGPLHRPAPQNSTTAAARSNVTARSGNDSESPSTGSATDILALQRTIGNQAVMRLLRSGAISTSAANAQKKRDGIQRALVMPAEPDFAAADYPEDGAPSYSDLLVYTNLLDTQVSTAYTDLVKTGGRLDTVFNGPTKDASDSYDVDTQKYSFDAANLKTLINEHISYSWDYDGAATSNNTVTNQQTLQYDLVESLRREMAFSVGRRMQRDKQDEVVKLREELAAEAIKLGTAPPDMGKFGAVALKGYQNELERHQKKQKKFAAAEKMAQSIMTEVAYTVVKDEILDNEQSVKDFLVKNKDDYRKKIKAPVKKDMATYIDETVNDQVARIGKYSNKLSTLKSGLSKNMWDMTKRKRRKELIHIAQKLNFHKLPDFTKDGELEKVNGKIKTQVGTRTKTEMDSLRFNIAQDFLSKFKSGGRVFGTGKRNVRHALKKKVTSGTKTYLDDAKQGDLGKQGVVKTAQEKVLKETLEGSMNSSLRKIGWLLDKVAPLPGDKGKLELVLKVPIGHTGGYLGFRFTGQFEHGDADVRKEIEKGKGVANTKNAADPFKVRSELAFVGGVKVPFVFDAGGELGLTYFEGESDRGALRVMDLVSFGYFRRFKESALVPDWAINMMWGMGGISQDKPKAPAAPTVPLPISPGNPPDKPSRNGRSQKIFKPFQDRYNQQLQDYTNRKQVYDNAMILYNQDQQQYQVAMEQYRADTTLGKKMARSNQAKRNEADAWGEAMQKSFTDKEYIETGFFASATGEANVAPTVGFKGSAKVLSGKRYTKQTMGALTTAKGTKLDGTNKRVDDKGNLKAKTWLGAGERERNVGRNIAGTEIAAEFSIGPFTMAGKTKLYWLLNQSAKTQKELETIQGAIKTKQQEVTDAKLIPQNDIQVGILEQELKDLKTEEGKINEDLRLLENQFFSFDLEVSGQSKASNSMLFGGPEMLTAAAMNYAAIAGSQLRSLIMSYTDTYAQRKNKGNVIGGDLAEDSGSALEGLTNAAGAFDPKKATMGHDMATNQEHFTKSFDNNNDMINQQMHSGHLGDQIQHSDHSQYIDSSGHAANAWDKVNQNQMKGGGGLKLLFKFQWKRDLGSKTTDKERAGIKIELSLEAAKGLTVGGHGMTASMEKTRRLFRLGTSRDKAGKWTMLSM